MVVKFHKPVLREAPDRAILRLASALARPAARKDHEREFDVLVVEALDAGETVSVFRDPSRIGGVESRNRWAANSTLG
ncbi:hypothetical protein [Mesorhizobium sp. CO1-1-4]|uniref:hypothetical protein n=1 Tax=Mesorhizobium sp. CO1-1-4 TaxID=2876633 RepID=UPI001CC9F04D|nr:hypothetical protein [Mesorhizobium sp. CO1-1-4]MBZ9740687.1 hypothetical protein [Mesorhizobium sp. CO1-1-4]